MKANKFFMSLCLMAAVGMFGMSSCSQDDILTEENGSTGGGNQQEGDGFYMGLTLKMPSGNNGGRSATVEPGHSTDGNEVGSDKENAVSSVLIVLANATDNSFIVSGTVLQDKLTPITDDNSYKTITKLQKTNLNDYYTQTNSRKVNVFVFCNPTKDLTDEIANVSFGDTGWKDLNCEVSEGNGSDKNTGIWNSFLMSNSAIAQRELPATMDDWERYKTEATAFDLSGMNAAGQASEVDNSASNNRGSIKVQRAVARFDFRDGSNNNNTYDVVLGKEGDNIITLVQVQLNRMALANMSNKFYYLPRVSSNGQMDGAVLCGPETYTNYLVGPYADKFKGQVTTGFSTYFNYPFFDNDGSYSNNTWNTSSISDVLKGANDNYNEGTHKPGDYKVWRYLTENLIPGPNSNQQKGITTTIIFKGKMLATEKAKTLSPDLANALENATGNPLTDPILYSFNGSLYCTWENVRKAAIAASVEMTDANIPATNADGKLVNVNRSSPLYVAVFGNGGIGTFTWGEAETEYTDDKAIDPTCANTAWNTWKNGGKKEDSTLAQMRKKVTDANFTIYQSSKDGDDAGYYCYYYYYNRHNDNSKPGTMGAMEFEVVRNNVYKLSVDKISQLGHPRIPENDPDSPKPEDPDESDDIYLTVTCRVLDWTVRVNGIIF